MVCNDKVSTGKNRDVKFQLRMTDDLRREFSIAAELRGAKMSSLLHQYIVKVIREEKLANPEAFAVNGNAQETTRGVMVVEKIELPSEPAITKKKRISQKV